MKFLDYMLIALVLIWIVAAFRHMIMLKKQGKSLCCGSCGSSCKKCNVKQKS